MKELHPMVNTEMWLPRENLFIFVLCIPIHTTPPHQYCVYTSLSYTRFSNQSKVFSPWICGNGHINNQVLFEFSLRICFDVYNNGLYPFLESQLVFCFILLCNIVLCGCMDISVRSEGELGRIYWKAYWSGRDQHFSNIEKYIMTF